VEKSIIQRLITLNQQFYQTFALQFSATRLRLQPGVKRLLADFPLDACILDLGCGNGELMLGLESINFQGQYVGVDFSSELLSIAKSRISALGNPPKEKFRFIQSDLTLPGWENNIPDFPFTLGLSFATLHHIPGNDLRKNIISNLRMLLSRHPVRSPVFMFSVWQFLNSERLSARIQPWERIGLREDDVEAGDFLLDWRYGGQGLRYVHQFDEAELYKLAEETGFSVKQSFYSDGQEGNLGLYQVWEMKRV
jgi:tRNA (uracil-5-)-methyltransferase TRM9